MMRMSRRQTHIGVIAALLFGASLLGALPASSDTSVEPSSKVVSFAGSVLGVDALHEEACTPGNTSFIDQPPHALAQLGIPQAWDLSLGDVTVAVVDSGVAAINPHLRDAVLPGIDLVTGGDGQTDTHGHGTAIAGIIAARKVEGSGLVGVAPQARILPVRVYVDTTHEAIQAGIAPDPLRTAEGIRWAADYGAAIIVVAMSTATDVTALREAVTYAHDRGSLVVASAGNVDDQTVDTSIRFPAAYPQSLSVTAVTSAGLPSDTVLHGTHVEVAAPGQDVLTTYMGYGDCIFSPNEPMTSYATAYASGVAALVASAHPAESPADWKYRMLATALRPAGALHDTALGWGIIAPFDAINFVNDGMLPGPDNPRFSEPGTQVLPVMSRTQNSDSGQVIVGLLPYVIAGGGTAIVIATLLVSILIRRNRAD